ncbi:MAG: bifunctional phosphopantothenoylcysteine decarboxylase/phosphopantothenate--cysteine ligase CoaBC [Dehalococcoidia bacterium]|nr:bifunctional phosphopantothenoylcysteine decarboxylase/phosphopantothenate--cysteine ligase CoaBC [Dehalococcoidia bacterium]
MLEGKRIILGVTGSIAAYKAADLASKLTQAGAEVHVILTPAAQQFITPLTFHSITHQPVVTGWWQPENGGAIQHVALAETADAVVIAPATADAVAKLAHGLADDPLGGTVLATRAPVLIAPAMDAHMYENPATQANVRLLESRGVRFVGPEAGRLASGLTGLGRLSAAETILGALRQMLGRGGDYEGKTVVVSAGPTEEPIDPARHITNRSSGKMGFALAEAARDRGARVVLVTGPVALASLYGVAVVRIRTALELQAALAKAMAGSDILIMSAAPADFRPAAVSAQKIKKGPEDAMSLDLIKNPDILAGLSGDFIKVGFAAESQELVQNAGIKLRDKGLDLIVANDITAPDSGFGVDTNRVLLIDREGTVEALPLLTKAEVANRILDRLVRFSHR